MHFLSSSSKYNVADALRLCRENGFIPEQILLLNRLGEKKEALALQLQNIKSIKSACKYIIDLDSGNTELWDMIVEKCKSNKEMFVELFEYLEYYGNPVFYLQNGLGIHRGFVQL